MASYPNQKTITISREIPKAVKDNKRTYMIVYNDVIEQACQNLTRMREIKLYLYLVKNQNNYRFSLSPQDVADRTGMNIDSAKSAVNDLIEKGYLIKSKNNSYTFYETPKDTTLEAADEVRKEFNSKNEGKVLLTYDELIQRVGEEKAKTLWLKAI